MSYALAVQVQERSVDEPPLPSESHGTDPSWSDDECEEVAFTAGNPRVEHITGVVHLYRDTPQAGASSSAPAQVHTC